MEYGANQSITNIYEYGAQRNSATINGSKGYYLYDGRGSVASLSGQSGGNVVQYSYDAYGVTTTNYGNQLNNPYRYNAEYTDSSTGNQYLRARYYDAASGRFLTKDTYLGYTKNADGEIEIVPEEAEIIREIYERYLSGESLHGIKCYLEAKEIPTPAGCSVWRQETIRSILSNEKYKGDAIINKTYVSDCISKRIKANNGERNKYYIENNHPAIIDAGTFARVQEEIARRSGKPKVKQKGTKTELSRYSSKYALSELLICGECRTPYRRCTWTAKGKRKIVWRCINRLDYGKKYCHHSPSIEESLLQDAVMRAIMQTAKQNIEVLKTLKIHIGMGLTDEVTEDKTLDIQIRIAEIDAEFQKMLKAVSADNADGIDEERITELMNEKQRLTVQLEQYATMRQKRESANPDSMRFSPYLTDCKITRWNMMIRSSDRSLNA